MEIVAGEKLSIFTSCSLYPSLPFSLPLALCQYNGVSVYCELKTCLMSGIHDNLERDFTGADPDLMEKLSRSRHSSEGEEDQEERVSMNL